jgi:hypothetical protein
MRLIKLIKNNLFIQNFFSTILAAILHPYLEFSLSKYTAIKKALYITANDETHGSYIEFGIFTGSSFNFAMRINKKIDKIFGDTKCEFFGFDSFKGFGEIKTVDIHPFFKNETFAVDKEKILKNIKKNSLGQQFRIIEGFYQDTIKNKVPEDFNIKKARVIMIDCDLKESAKLALEFIRPSIQNGTIILFDDYIFYKGDPNKGEYSAFEEFKKKYPDIFFRRAFDYGYGSRAFIAYINKL